MRFAFAGALVSLVCAVSPVVANAGISVATESKPAASNVALIVAVEAYKVSSLSTPAADALAMNAQLKRLGYSTVVVVNPDTTTLKAARDQFVNRVTDGPVDTALIYLSGRGERCGGKSWLFLPDDERPSVNLEGMIQELAAIKGAGPSSIVVLNDACGLLCPGETIDRETNQPAVKLRSLGAQSPLVVVGFSASAGEAALDSTPENAANSPYAMALLDVLKGQSIRLLDWKDTLAAARVKVITASDGKQSPYVWSSR